MSDEMPDWFGKEDAEDLKKLLTRIIKKVGKRRDKMDQIEKDAIALKHDVDNIEENNAGITRVQFVAVISILQHFMNVNKQDGEEVNKELYSLEEMKKKLSKLEKI